MEATQVVRVMQQGLGRQQQPLETIRQQQVQAHQQQQARQPKGAPPNSDSRNVETVSASAVEHERVRRHRNVIWRRRPLPKLVEVSPNGDERRETFGPRRIAAFIVVDIHNLQINTLVFSSSICLFSERFNFSRRLSQGVELSEICISRQSNFCLASWFSIPRTSFPVLETLTHTTPHWLPNASTRIIISLPPSRIRCWVLDCVPGFPMLLKTKFQPDSRFPGTYEAPEASEGGLLCAHFFFMPNMLALVFCHHKSFFGPSFLCSPRHGVRLLLYMAARKHREIHDVEQTKKMCPLITREISTCLQVGSWCQHI